MLPAHELAAHSPDVNSRAHRFQKNSWDWSMTCSTSAGLLPASIPLCTMLLTPSLLRVSTACLSCHEDRDVRYILGPDRTGAARRPGPRACWATPCLPPGSDERHRLIDARRRWAAQIGWRRDEEVLKPEATSTSVSGESKARYPGPGTLTECWVG
jgi:hypothetical protein